MMKQYSVKLRGEPLMVISGDILLFDSKFTMPLRKDGVNFFNAEDVVFILPVLNPEIKN